MTRTTTDGAAPVTNGSGLPPIKETIGTTRWRAQRLVRRSLVSAVTVTVGLALLAAGLLVAARLFQAARMR